MIEQNIQVPLSKEKFVFNIHYGKIIITCLCDGGRCILNSNKDVVKKNDFKTETKNDTKGFFSSVEKLSDKEKKLSESLYKEELMHSSEDYEL